MSDYVLEWLNLLARWFHLTAGIAWIGASFYFVWLDDHLEKPAKASDAARGVHGELWSVHGGGFYHNQKFLTGPKDEPLTQNLHWFKWEAYATWLSGMALLALVYWAGAQSYTIDRTVLALTVPQAIGLSIFVIVAGWFVYDALCRLLSARPLALGLAIYLSLVAAAYALSHVFSARAAYIHVGAIIGTIMVANVLFAIIPGQRRMLAQIRAGQEPDPRPGQLGKIRSVHNTYLTLPVLFIMISNHYPLTYDGRYGWLALAALSAAGVLVRRFFILTHSKRFVYGLVFAAVLLIAGTAAALVPRPAPTAGHVVTFAQVAPVVAERCAVCHAAQPARAGYSAAPRGVLLDSPERIAAQAAAIDRQAVRSHAMPLGNATAMTQAERDLLGAWIAAGAKLR